jgi:hypothetical protein
VVNSTVREGNEKNCVSFMFREKKCKRKVKYNSKEKQKEQFTITRLKMER